MIGTGSKQSINDRIKRKWREFLHRYPLILFCVSGIAGIWLDSIWYQSLQRSLAGWSAFCLMITSAFTIRLLVQIRTSPDRVPRGATGSQWLPVLLCVAAFGCWHAVCESNYRGASIQWLLEQSPTPIAVRGQIDRTVSLRKNLLSHATTDRDQTWQSQLTVRLDSVRRGKQFEQIDGRVSVFVNGDLSYLRPGDFLEIYGWLHPFDAPTNPGEPDLRPSYRRRGLHGKIEVKDATQIIKRRTSNHYWSRAIATIATSGRESLFRHTDETTGPLAVALVIGQREFVDPEIRDALLATGTAHLLSVSGMHLAILVGMVAAMISALGFQPASRLVLIVTVCLIYVAVTGGRPPVIRAAILIATLLLATCFRRTSQPLNTLAFAAMLLMAINPTNVFSVGVHLSFLAVITLMYCGTPILPGSMRSGLQRENEQIEEQFDALIEESSPWTFQLTRRLFHSIWQLGRMSLFISAISMPLVWFQFHLVSVISVLTNVMVWVGMIVALPAGVITIILDSLYEPLGVLPGLICHVALWYMWMVIDWMQSIPMGHFWLPSPPVWFVGLFYMLMAGSLLWKKRAARWFRWGLVPTWAAIALVLALRVDPLPENTIEATFVDVGHGTSVILRHDEQVWLYDCGRMGNWSQTSRDIDTALWSMGIRRLDGVFLSHADADHYNAFPAIAQRFVIDRVITPPRLLSSTDPGLQNVQMAIEKHAIPVIQVAVDRPPPKSIAPLIRVLHPPWQGVGGNDNANSLVLSIDNGRKCMLLPGDLEPPGTQVLTQRDRPRWGGLLMAPHHGSLTMDAETILAWCKPRETIVSGGKRAARVEVHEMLSVMGSGVHVTANEGAVRVRITESGSIQIRCWNTHPW